MGEALAVRTAEVGGVPAVPARRFPGHAAGVTAMVVVAAVAYAAYSLLRLRSFRAGTYDLVIFDQAVRSYSRFEAPVALVKGVHNGFGAGFTVLGDHFSPMLAVLAPLYWIHDGPGTLLVAQAVLFSLAIVPVWMYTARRLGRGAAYGFAAAYALSWPVAEALAFDFHEVAFVPPLSALMVERYDAGRRWQAAAAACALLLVKEDMGLLVAGFGMVLLTCRGERRIGGAYIAGGVGATFLASQVLIPAFDGERDYYWAYGALGDSVSEVAVTVATRPWIAMEMLVSPPLKVITVGLLILPFLLLPLRSPLIVAIIPLLAERMLAQGFTNWWEPRYHYNAFLVAIVVLAAADGLHRFGRSRRIRAWLRTRPGVPLPFRPGSRYRTWWSPGPRTAGAVLAGAALVTVPFFAFAELADPDLYGREPAAVAAAGLVPDGALVEAANHLGPALSPRARVLLWDQVPREAAWIVADIERHSFPFLSVREQRRQVAYLLSSGYREVYREAGYVVLSRTSGNPG